MEATSVFLAVRSSDDVIATIAESQEVFSLWSAPRLYTEVHRACKRVFKSGLTSYESSGYELDSTAERLQLVVVFKNGVFRVVGCRIEILCCN
jgi:hypothetical protein